MLVNPLWLLGCYLKIYILKCPEILRINLMKPTVGGTTIVFDKGGGES
jgi:hypothetical protein